MGSQSFAQVGERLIKYADGTERHIRIDKDGVIYVPAFKLPPSSLLSADAREAIVSNSIDPQGAHCKYDMSSDDAIHNYRKCADKVSEKQLAKLRTQYDVTIEHKEIKGVDTYIVMPVDDVAPVNKDRVLINIPGSGFVRDPWLAAQIYAVPVAAKGHIKVVGVDYRTAPEWKHPAAIEDVMIVYRELLKEYKAENIGIYGASAGSRLAAQTVPWFQKEGLPQAGALGMFCGAGPATFELDNLGDSAAIVWALSGFSYEDFLRRKVQNPYFDGVDQQDPLFAPIVSSDLMKRFPPSLLMGSTRDVHLSQTVHAHAQFVKYGLDTDIHVWDGLNHCKFLDVQIPEGRQANDVIIKFFNKNLGK